MLEFHTLSYSYLCNICRNYDNVIFNLSLLEGVSQPQNVRDIEFP